MDIVSTLQQDPEPIPDWLEQPSPRFDRESFFGSRTVYYPGSGNDGQPVSICARAHAAHAFIYVDYGVSMADIHNRVHGVGDPGFRGYVVEHEEEIEESVLRPGGWTPHVQPSELKEGAYRFASVRPFGLYVVLRRDEEHDESHGPNRLAVLFVGGDGHATYDALYCQEDGTRAPFLVVVQDHGFGGDYGGFGAGGLLERIAGNCGVHPKYLLAGERGDDYDPWDGYRDTGASPAPGGMHGIPRRLFLREQAMTSQHPKPNLFDYATKELSQDAVICWLIKWSGTQTETESEQALRELGRAFVNALLRKHQVSLRGSVRRTEIHQQNLGIDVLARVHDEETSHVLLIEDKTDTDRHSGQLDRYHERVLKGESKLGEVHPSSISSIFLKTGNQSRSKDRQIAGKTKFKVFGRREFLTVLDGYPGDHPIVTDFRERLRRRETEFRGYRRWARNDDRSSWSWYAWEGFFRALEGSINAGWSYVPNRSGGFEGFWWHWVKTTPGDLLYLQLEIVPRKPERQNLCFRVELRESTGREARDRYRRAVLAAGQGQVVRPARMGTGRTMAVGVWKADWLAFSDDGRLDIGRTVRNLQAAERIIDEAAENT